MTLSTWRQNGKLKPVKQTAGGWAYYSSNQLTDILRNAIGMGLATTLLRRKTRKPTHRAGNA